MAEAAPPDPITDPVADTDTDTDVSADAGTDADVSADAPPSGDAAIIDIDVNGAVAPPVPPPEAGLDQTIQGEPPGPERIEARTDDPIADTSAEADVRAEEPLNAEVDEVDEGDEVDDHGGGGDHGPHLRNPKIPPTGNTQTWFRSSTFVDYFGNNYNPLTNDDQFVAIVNYLNFGSDTRLKKWSISASARVDTSNLFNVKSQALCDFNNDGQVTSAESGQCRYVNADYRLERFQLRVSNKYVEVTAGDFNVNFGRGIALSVRKIADIGVDATVKGGRIAVTTKKIELTGLAGLANRNQSDFATRTTFADPGYPHGLCQDKTPGLIGNAYGNRVWSMCSDIISGGRLDAKLPGKVKLGAHYVFMWFGEKIGDQYEGLHLAGGDISRKRIAKNWDLFAGVTALLRNPHHDPRFGGHYENLVQNGVAAYLSNGLTFGNTFVLIEGKYYDNYVIAKDASSTTVQYTEAPTLERADQIIPAAANSAGGRILIEHTLPKSRVTLLANYLGYAFASRNEEDMFDPNVGEMTHHGYVGMRWRNLDKGTEVQVTSGYRWEGYQRPHEEGVAPYVRRLPQAVFYVSQALPKKTNGLSHSLSLRADWRYEQVQKTQHKQFHRGNIILGYGLSPFLNLALIGGFSSEFAPLTSEPKLHPQPCDDEANCNRKPHLWPGAEVRINFLESSFLRIFAGRQVGGLLCVNGSCRNLPDFEGVRMDLIFSF